MKERMSKAATPAVNQIQIKITGVEEGESQDWVPSEDEREAGKERGGKEDLQELDTDDEIDGDLSDLLFDDDVSYMLACKLGRVNICLTKCRSLTLRELEVCPCVCSTKLSKISSVVVILITIYIHCNKCPSCVKVFQHFITLFLSDFIATIPSR